MPDKPLVKYIGFLLAFLTSLFTIVAPEAWTWFSPDVGWALAGLFGSVGLLQLRLFIDSKGYKTWIMLGGQVILSALLGFGTITAEIYAQLYALVTSIAGVTVLQAKTKEVNGTG